MNDKISVRSVDIVKIEKIAPMRHFPANLNHKNLNFFSPSAATMVPPQVVTFVYLFFGTQPSSS